MTLKHVSLIRIAPHYARSPARSTLGLFCASAHRSRHAAPPLPPLPPHCDPTRGSATPESLCSPKEAPVHVLQASGPWIKEHRCQPPSHPHLRPSVPLSLSLSLPYVLSPVASCTCGCGALRRGDQLSRTIEFVLNGRGLRHMLVHCCTSLRPLRQHPNAHSNTQQHTATPPAPRCRRRSDPCLSW